MECQLNGGSIAGIVIASLFCCICVVVIIYYIMVVRKDSSADDEFVVGKAFTGDEAAIELTEISTDKSNQAVAGDQAAFDPAVIGMGESADEIMEDSVLNIDDTHEEMEPQKSDFTDKNTPHSLQLSATENTSPRSSPPMTKDDAKEVAMQVVRRKTAEGEDLTEPIMQV